MSADINYREEGVHEDTLHDGESEPLIPEELTDTFYASNSMAKDESLFAGDEDEDGGKFFLSDEKGMLFIFDDMGYPAIWMKDMLFPIDIAWLDSDFRIVDIAADVSPQTYPTVFRPELPAKYVLEVNAGFFASRGVKEGDTLRLVERE